MRIAAGTAAVLVLENVQCEDEGSYSVVFWNKYGEALSVDCVLDLPGSKQVVVTPPVTVLQSQVTEDVVLTAEYCIPGELCGQWYLTPLGGGPKVNLQGKTGNVLRIVAPITCDELGTSEYEVFDNNLNRFAGSASVTAGAPTLSISSATLKLNPDHPNVSSYVCEEALTVNSPFLPSVHRVKHF